MFSLWSFLSGTRKEKKIAVATAAAAADRVPSAADCLYAHALESIFGFLSLAELGAILAVSRSWSAAVGSMRGLDATVESVKAAHPLTGICASGLARHIGTLGMEEDQLVSVTRAELSLIAQRMRSLHTLHCKFALSSSFAGAFHFPPLLTWLDCEISKGVRATEINQLVEAASVDLPKLSIMELNLQQTSATDLPLVTLAPFLANSNLREFGVYYGIIPLQPGHAEVIRSMPQLTRIIGTMDLDDLRALLRRSQLQLQLQKLDFEGLPSAEMVELLHSLPLLSLTWR